jgi:hypothetical protein
MVRHNSVTNVIAGKAVALFETGICDNSVVAIMITAFTINTLKLDISFSVWDEISLCAALVMMHH